MHAYPDLDRPADLGYIPAADQPLKIFCVKLCGDDLLHFLPATSAQDDYYGHMEVFHGAERIAWYPQPLVEYWALEEAAVFLNPRWKARASSVGDAISEMMRGQAPMGMDDGGGLWYQVSVPEGG